MGCLVRKEGEDFVALLVFERDQLLYDIRNYCYVEGHVLPATAEVHQRHTVQDVGEDGNVDRVTRVLDLGIAEVREMLYPYTKRTARRLELTDRLKEKRQYEVLLKVPAEVSQTTLTYLERNIHEYLVCLATSDWMSICNPEKEQTWRMKAEEAAARIRMGMTMRMQRVRIRMHPF